MGDAIIYIGAIAGALVAIGLLLRYVVVKPLKSWFTEEIREPVAVIRAQLLILTKRFDDHLTAYHLDKTPEDK